MIYDDDNAVANVSQSGPSDPVAGLMTSGPEGKPRVALGFLHAVNPESGVEVVFTPGEAIPEWAQDVQYDRLRPATAQTKPGASGTGKSAVRRGQAKQGRAE